MKRCSGWQLTLWEISVTVDVQSLGKVAVLMGGPSSEREISLLSGSGVLAALKEKGVDAHAFDPAIHCIFDLPREKFDRVFVALHGRFGEDGTVQGVLETLKIPYTGSGVMASALAMDKWRTKLVWQAAGIPTPRYHVLGADSDPSRVLDDLGLPLIVKPAREGSSIGVSKVNIAGEFPAAFSLAQRLDPLVIAEQFIAGQELTAAIVGDDALPLVRIEAPEGKYDYANKYFTEDVRYHCPAGVRAALEDEIRLMALRAFRVLGCSGWGRADLILRPDGSYAFLEMNTSPGMTGHSLVPMAARAVGLSYPDLCVRLLSLARCNQ
ncbi:MAG: D-alanine--D-alanine ligase [Rhodocyclaceae bacterium]|nr:D-alanine--D-alanine ligase [Rhodocyclaceae bacterium]